MAGANSNIQMTDLDFNNIKNSLKTYLQSQDTLKDYNYEGSALSTLLDVLAYNTQYNSFYLNQVANEMFLDTAIQRGSVVSQAKVLGYVPKSAIAPSAEVDLSFTGVTDGSLTLPKFTTFMSEAIDGVNYNFVSTDSQTVNVSGGVATFNNVTLKQGIPATVSYTVNSITNPSYTFEIPETNVDTTTISVVVQQSSTNSASQVYTLASNYLTLNENDTVFFLQESITGTYEIYFGNGILGKLLSDGNIVSISYVVTQGNSSAGANNFVLMDSVGGYSTYTLTSVIEASQGGAKESISSIKYQAPKSYAAQGRAVTKNDYITAIQQNNLGIAFDAVNVWGGEENDPPVYGQVFISMKPKNAYSLTSVQKQRIISEVIKPVSVLTISPTVSDPDYTYLTFNVDVVYDSSKTAMTASQIQAGVIAAIKQFANDTLNTFNSTFNGYDLMTAIQGFSSSIVNSEYKLKLQKRFYPDLISAATYKLDFNTTLDKGILLSGINSTPAIQFRDPTNLSNIIDQIYIEEVPVLTNGIESISVVNPGYDYQSIPTIQIVGDGTGATAHAEVINGQISSIIVDSNGTGYTTAYATITNATGDITGQGGLLSVNLQGRYGTLRSYYNSSNKIKTIFSDNVGTVDYNTGIVTLTSFGPSDVDNALGQLTITANPVSSIISSAYNKIITVDVYDPAAIVVNVTAK